MGEHVFTEWVLLVALAAAGAALFERLRLPSIVGFLVTGAVVGPGGAGLVADPEAVQRIAELGVVFLLFEIGLELPMERLHRLLRRGFAIGALQVGGTLCAVAACAMWLGLSAREAWVAGALVAMSSTALCIRLLGDRGELDAPHGQIALGVLLFQDLCIVPFLLAVPLLAAGGPLQPLQLALQLARAIGAVVLFFVVARFAVPRLLSLAARARSREVFSLAAVLVVMGGALAVEPLGLSLAVGAFLAGLAASATPWGPQLFAEVQPLRGVLLGVFFTAVGMLLNVGAAAEQAAGIALFLLAAVVLKALLAALAVRAVVRDSASLAARAGLVLAQTGEFSFVLAAAAFEAEILSDELRQIFIAGSVLSLLLTPLLLRAAPVLLRLFEGRDLQRDAAPSAEAPAAQIALVGFGLASRNMARVLDAIGVPWAAVDANPKTVAQARQRGRPVWYGDATRPGLLQRIGAAQARLVVVALSDPVATRQSVTLLRRIAPRAQILARARYVRDVDALQEAGALHVVAEEFEGAIALLAPVLRELNIAEGAIARFAEALRGEGYALLQAPPALALDPWLAEVLSGDAP